MTRHAARRDANHDEVKQVFFTLLAGHCTDTSAAGDGVGDLYVSFGGESGPAWGCHVEIKSSETAPFTAAQIRFRKTHPGLHYRVWDIAQATTLCRYIRRQVQLLAGPDFGDIPF